jgi:hypothetical protein
VGRLNDFPKLVNSPGFKFKRVTRKRDSSTGRSSILAEFELSPSAEYGIGIQGTLTLEPELDHAITGYDFVTRYTRQPQVTIHQKGTIAYIKDGPAAALTLPAAIHAYTEDRQPNRRSVGTQDFVTEEWSLAEVPGSEFTLAHYGLGDYERRPRIPWTVFLTALLLTAAAICFAWWRTRRRRVLTVGS